MFDHYFYDEARFGKSVKKNISSKSFSILFSFLTFLCQ
jgi:hypothetical protein